MSTLVVTFQVQPGANPEAPTAVTPSGTVRPKAFRLGRQPVRVDKACSHTSAPLGLRAKREADEISYEFITKRPLGSIHSLRCDQHDLDAVVQRLATLAHTSFRATPERKGSDHESCWNGLRELGSVLAQQVLPRGVRKKLAAGGAQGLLISHSPDLIAVPWELIRADDEFLCLQYALGRQVLMQSSFSSLVSVGPATKDDLRVLIVCNPTEDLPQAQATGEGILSLLESSHPQVSVEYLSGARVKRLDLLARLGRTDIVYYCGHADYDAQRPSESGWRLKDGRITCTDFRSLVCAPRLVFANGCETGREGNWADNSRAGTDAHGLASAFLFAGVSSYIGTVWPIPERSSALFAKAFFHALVIGHSVGECVREARREVIEKRGAGDLVWASYVYYGDPSCQFPHLMGK